MAILDANRSARISLTATVFAPISILVMIYLVETYTPDSLSVQDVHPVGRVFFCILAATLLSAFAVISAIRPIIEMRIAPLVGLTVLGFGWVAFVRWYDWEGLLEHGKAWVGLEYAENGDGIGAVRAVEVVKKWVQPFPAPYPVKRLTRSFESKLFPRCSPSGQFLIYVWYRPSTPEFPHSRIQLRAVDRNGKNDRLLLPDQEMAIPNQTSPSFSPDGRLTCPRFLYQGL